jgi:hypothetical protein
VTRQFLLLREEEAFVIFDRVETTRDDYLPKFLLHSNAKPVSRQEEVVQGLSDNGILVTSDREFTHQHRDGWLSARVLLPELARTYKIGGPDYCFYVEFDSDQTDGFDGKNLVKGSGRRGSERMVDQWRLEVEPTKPVKSTRFMTVLLPRPVGENQNLPRTDLLASGSAGGVARVGKTVLFFSPDGDDLESVQIPASDAERCLLLDASPGGAYRLNGGEPLRASDEGVLRFDCANAEGLEIRLASRSSG